MFSEGGRKSEYPERTSAYTGRTCKLHTERPQLGIEPANQLWKQWMLKASDCFARAYFFLYVLEK